MKVKIGMAQLNVSADKKKNIAEAKAAIEKLADADIIVLPEIWNGPYDTKCFREYGETEKDGESIKMLSEMAAKLGKIIVGGSISELDGDRVYNTSFVFDRQGKIIAKHRKMHLFDIDVKGGQSFKESLVLSAGEDVTVFDTPFCKVGLCICYDYRFPELARLMALKGAQIIIVPAAFNMTTGPAHWEIMFRSRSLDNQVYSVGVAPARDENGGYVSYANSIAVSPWGDVIKRFGEKEQLEITELDLDRVYEIREQLPLLKHRREDVYILKETEK